MGQKPRIFAFITRKASWTYTSHQLFILSLYNPLVNRFSFVDLYNSSQTFLPFSRAFQKKRRISKDFAGIIFQSSIILPDLGIVYTQEKTKNKNRIKTLLQIKSRLPDLEGGFTKPLLQIIQQDQLLRLRHRPNQNRSSNPNHRRGLEWFREEFPQDGLAHPLLPRLAGCVPQCQYQPESAYR